MRQDNSAEQIPDQSRMKRWDSWLINDMPATNDVQVIASGITQSHLQCQDLILYLLK